MGDLAAGADADLPEFLHGCCCRILGARGPAPPGGAIDYRVNGHMLAGRALLAVPAQCAESGVTTFAVAENDVSYEADLGDVTPTRVRVITAFDPGEGWAPSA